MSKSTTSFVQARINLVLKQGFASLENFPVSNDCTVAKWHVKPGDRVRQFDSLGELEVQGQTVEIPSRADGVIAALHYAVGQNAKLGTSLLTLSVEDKRPTPTVSLRTKEFMLADPGEGTAEIEMVKWYVKPGDTVRQSDLICEATSHKASLEYKSPWPGVVKELHYLEGQMAPVGSSLFSVDVAEEVAPGSIPVNAGPVTVGPPKKVQCSPAARLIAIDHKVNLLDVTATGPGGRVTKEDLVNFIAQGKSSSPLAPPPVAPPKPAARPIAVIQAPSVVPTPISAVIQAEDKRVPITGVARVMVQTMTYANSIPQFGFCDEVLCDALVEVRKGAKSIAEKKGLKLSYMPFILKAISNALKQFPSLNAHVNDVECSEVVYKGSHNIGFAMDTSRGLLVPNVKGVQNMSILDIARELDRLQKLGEAGKMGKPDLTGGTFTISNIGSIGGTYAKPILLKPEVMIGALGKMQVLPRFDSDMKVRPVTIMNVSWAADHRVVDGATCARFSNLWKSYLENPMSMFIE
jgi:2-oxoisovalerate dehydrogenase E2 component (dihydrolipoyl transacylase)